MNVDLSEAWSRLLYFYTLQVAPGTPSPLVAHFSHFI